MIEVTAQELRGIARSSTDGAGYFPALYAGVTARVAASIADGRFEAGTRMDELASTFAALYTGAWRDQAGAPRCWQAAWAVRADPELLIVQHLLLGINAHVNHDLPLAVVRVAGPGGDLGALRADFDAVNDVLAARTTDVLHQLDRVSRWTNAAAALGGGRLFNFSLQVARQRAWEAAERLHSLDAAGQRAYRAELDELVTVLAYLITQPAWVVRPALWLARRLEEHDPVTVITALLGDG